MVTRSPPDFDGMTTKGLEYGEVECCIRPATRYWSKVTSTFFAMMALMRCGLGVTGALPPGTRKASTSTSLNRTWIPTKRQAIRSAVGVGDAEDIPRFEIRDSNERKNLSPGGDEVLLNRR